MKKEVFITIHEQMLAEHRRLEKQIHSLQSQIASLPEGKIICTHNANRYKWYRSDGHTSTYLPKHERKLAEQLAYKKYLSHLLDDALQEKKAIDFYLRHHNSNISEATRMLHDHPEYQDLLSPYIKPFSQEIDDWMNSPYKKNLKHPEQLIHRTNTGHIVRSKSEALIDMLLVSHHIPFRYECALHLGDITIYPDFTLRHPKTGTLYYWEHFGKMDDSAYSQNAFSKLKLYTSYGIIPSIQLITTYETKEHPLSSAKIESIIKEYFL